jgi:transposase-like protein
MTGGSVEGLSESQETALAALREGASFVAAAGRAGVSRATVYRWVQSNPHFQAAYNTWQRELAESARARLLKLTEKAVDVLEKALERNDEQIALQMLRHTGVMRRRRVRSTDVEVLDLQNQLKERREHRRAAKGMLHNMLGNMGLPRKAREQIISGQDAGAFIKRLADSRAQAAQTGDETKGETPAPPEDPTDAEGSGDSDEAPPANSLPRQDMNAEEAVPSLKLAGETTGEAPNGASHEPDAERKSQMVEGWRVGTKLYAVP